MPTLLPRVVTATILIAVLTAILFYVPPLGFKLLLLLFLLAAAYEWVVLSGIHGFMPRASYVVGVTLLGGLSLVWIEQTIVITLTMAAGWWLWAGYLIKRYRVESDKTTSWKSRCVAGVVVLIPPVVALAKLGSMPDGDTWVLALFVVIWVSDTAAYFVGRVWGRHKLMPNVSPGKTIEGAIGGLIGVGIVALAASRWFDWRGMTVIAAVAASLVVSFFGIVGDLYESLVKRQAGVKDSGRLLPGHGGVLDRIDSLTASAPIATAFILIARGGT